MANLKQIKLTADIYSSDLRFIKAIQNKVEIEKVFCEAERASLQINDFCKFNGIDFIPLESLEQTPTTQKESKVGLTYGFGMIFSKSKILEYEHGIWNFHPGDLPKYRGRHPITHAFLEGEEVLVMRIGHYCTSPYNKVHCQDTTQTGEQVTTPGNIKIIVCLLLRRTRNDHIVHEEF